jgi:hypothetical protein
MANAFSSLSNGWFEQKSTENVMLLFFSSWILLSPSTGKLR